jgi:hypothetical protein
VAATWRVWFDWTPPIDQVLELARLVAAVREPAVAVVALGPHARAAEMGGQAVERMDRRGPERERLARE